MLLKCILNVIFQSKAKKLILCHLAFSGGNIRLLVIDTPSVSHETEVWNIQS